ncbi:hypothetical protein HUI25_005437 [Escherichia coli]|nr:hypothetical protein [Escherichia coli]EFI6095886.1 hypothetical protein [Escherichia coli]EFJ1100468.1 hypothetical protein [Escherichia coli]EFJ2841027.1 hypothetical protein [Escherichia coli]EFU2656034.1 hypothetical protein [Escherichia coli]
MSTITKEWLQRKITEFKSWREDIPFGLDEDDHNMLIALEIALASLEAEPVAECIVEDGGMRIDGFGEYVGHSLPDGRHELYAAPLMPTLQAVLERLRTIVADPRALPRRKEWVSGQQYSYVLLENVEAMVDEACRAAMLQGKGE